MSNTRHPEKEPENWRVKWESDDGYGLEYTSPKDAGNATGYVIVLYAADYPTPEFEKKMNAISKFGIVCVKDRHDSIHTPEVIFHVELAKLKDKAWVAAIGLNIERWRDFSYLGKTAAEVFSDPNLR